MHGRSATDCLGALLLGLNLEEYFVWRRIEILQQRRAEPALDIEVWGVVPIAFGITPAPFEAECVAGKGDGCKYQKESRCSVRNMGNSTVDDNVRAANKGLCTRPWRGSSNTLIRPANLYGEMTLIEFMAPKAPVLSLHMRKLNTSLAACLVKH